MSVPVNKRGESKYAFYYDTMNLCDDIIKFLIKDFGMKSISRDLKSFTYSAKMDEYDRETFIEICEKYNIDVEAAYPYWVLETMRNTILDATFKLQDAVVRAYSIFPGTNFEVNLRRSLQHEAIGACELLLVRMNQAIRIFSTGKKKANIEKYMVYVENATDVIKKLREWKKRCNKLDRGIINREFMNDLGSVEKSYHLVEGIIDEKLKASGIEPKKVDIDKKKLAEEIINKKKEEEKKRKIENKLTSSPSRDKKDTNKSIITKLNNNKNINQLIPEDDLNIQSNKIIKDKRIPGISYDYSNPIVICDGVTIPKCIYNEEFKVKIFVGKVKEGVLNWPYGIDSEISYKENLVS